MLEIIGNTTPWIDSLQSVCLSDHRPSSTLASVKSGGIMSPGCGGALSGDRGYLGTDCKLVTGNALQTGEGKSGG